MIRSNKRLDDCTRKKCRGVARPMQDGERRQRGRRIVEKKVAALGRTHWYRGVDRSSEPPGPTRQRGRIGGLASLQAGSGAGVELRWTLACTQTSTTNGWRGGWSAGKGEKQTSGLSLFQG